MKRRGSEPGLEVTYVNDQGIYETVHPQQGGLVVCFDRMSMDVITALNRQAPQDQAQGPIFLLCKQVPCGQVNLNVFCMEDGLKYFCCVEKFHARFFGLFSLSRETDIRSTTAAHLRVLLQKIDDLHDVPQLDALMREVTAW